MSSRRYTHTVSLNTGSFKSQSIIQKTKVHSTRKLRWSEVFLLLIIIIITIVMIRMMFIIMIILLEGSGPKLVFY